MACVVTAGWVRSYRDCDILFFTIGYFQHEIASKEAELSWSSVRCVGPSLGLTTDHAFMRNTFGEVRTASVPHWLIAWQLIAASVYLIIWKPAKDQTR